MEQVYSSDRFMVDENEEEFLMFTVEMCDHRVRRQDGPHHTLRWRKKVRSEYKRPEVKAMLSP